MWWLGLNCCSWDRETSQGLRHADGVQWLEENPKNKQKKQPHTRNQSDGLALDVAAKTLRQTCSVTRAPFLSFRAELAANKEINDK